MRSSAFAAAVLVAVVDAESRGGIIQVLDDFASFENLGGPFTAIDFVAPPSGPGAAISPSAYSQFGLTLSTSPQGDAVLSVINEWGFSFPDGWGIADSSSGQSHFLAFDFASPIKAFGFEKGISSGTLLCDFYLGGQLVGTDKWTLYPRTGSHFVGWVTDFEFDRVVPSVDWLDNVYFATIPSPHAVALIAVALAARSWTPRGRRP